MSRNNLFRLFVYGTLKRGYWNHDVYCGSAVSIEAATVRGRLYEMPSGIPVLKVPGADIIAQGSANVLTDLALQPRHEVGLVGHSECDGDDWRWIEGELVSLPHPLRTVPPIDRLEGFSPDGPSLYRRVLVPVRSGGCVTAAWCYVAGPSVTRMLTPTLLTRWG